MVRNRRIAIKTLIRLYLSLLLISFISCDNRKSSYFIKKDFIDDSTYIEVMYQNNLIIDSSKYRNGKKIGLSKIVLPEDSLYIYTNFDINGKESGQIKYYNFENEIVTIGQMEKDDKIGNWYFYDDGLLSEFKHYRTPGVCSFLTKYDRNGNVTSIEGEPLTHFYAYPDSIVKLNEKFFTQIMIVKTPKCSIKLTGSLFNNNSKEVIKKKSLLSMNDSTFIFPIICTKTGQFKATHYWELFDQKNTLIANDSIIVNFQVISY